MASPTAPFTKQRNDHMDLPLHNQDTPTIISFPPLPDSSTRSLRLTNRQWAKRYILAPIIAGFLIGGTLVAGILIVMMIIKGVQHEQKPILSTLVSSDPVHESKAEHEYNNPLFTIRKLSKGATSATTPTTPSLEKRVVYPSFSQVPDRPYESPQISTSTPRPQAQYTSSPTYPAETSLPTISIPMSEFQQKLNDAANNARIAISPIRTIPLSEMTPEDYKYLLSALGNADEVQAYITAAMVEGMNLSKSGDKRIAWTLLHGELIPFVIEDGTSTATVAPTALNERTTIDNGPWRWHTRPTQSAPPRYP